MIYTPLDIKHITKMISNIIFFVSKYLKYKRAFNRWGILVEMVICLFSHVKILVFSIIAQYFSIGVSC